MIAKSNLIFKIIIFFIVFLTIDFIFTKLIFSKLLIKNLENIYSQDLDNRIPNKDYKYTFNNNVEFLSKYKDSIYKIHTNDLGFRDFSSSDFLTIILGTSAVFFASINVVGGYLVTNRMLGMFKKK